MNDALLLEHDLSENRCTLFRIMLEPFNETTCAQPAAARSNSSGELRHQHALIPAAPAVIVVIEVMIAFVGTETGIDTHEIVGVIGRP